VGYGKTRKQIIDIVESTAQEKGLLRKARISQGWFCCFIEHQPQLSVRKGDCTAFLRIDARYKEGFDLPDPRYLAWLKVHYPTEPCQELCQFFQMLYLLIQ